MIVISAVLALFAFPQMIAKPSIQESKLRPLTNLYLKSTYHSDLWLRDLVANAGTYQVYFIPRSWKGRLCKTRVVRIVHDSR